MVLIHEKITALLEQRRLKKRDLARALGVSPQTATDICKGRSAITLPHLRNLIRYFEVRAEFWLDDDRLAPVEIDQLARREASDAIMRTGMLAVEDPEQLMKRVRGFLQKQRASFLAAHPDLTAAEQHWLGLSVPEQHVSAQHDPAHAASKHGVPGTGVPGTGKTGTGIPGTGITGTIGKSDSATPKAAAAASQDTH